MRMITRLMSVGALSGLLFAPSVQAEILDYNHAFSYSEIGSETVSYGEKTLFVGEELNMNTAVTNIAQRSGGYTPISEFAGFYVQTSTTLDPLSTTEEWILPTYGVVQRDERKVRWNELNIMYSWLFANSGYHVVGGVNIATLSFIRSYFRAGEGTPALNAYLATIYPPDPVTGDPVELTFSDGAITEDSTHMVANVGFRYDSTFLDPDETTRLLWGVSVGVPMYYKVENSNFPGVTWTSNFEGYDITANVGYGFQIYEKFMLSMSSEFLYKFRPETEGIAVTGGTGKIPDVTIGSLRLALGVEWSY